jgi:O-antigen/teichoic acid export membrane protein
MSLSQKAIRASLWSSSIGYIRYFLNLIINIFLARILIPEDFGEYSFVLSFVEILFMPGMLGFSRACIHLQHEKDVFDTGLIINGTVALSLFFIGIIAAFISRLYFSYDMFLMIIILCLSKTIRMPTNLQIAHFEKDLNFKMSMLIVSISSILALFTSLILAMRGFGKWSLIIREILLSSLILILALIFSPHQFHFKYNKETAKKILRYSSNIFLLRVSEILFLRLPKFLMGIFSGIQILGFYERSMFLANLPNATIGHFYTNVLFSVFSKVKDDNKKISYGLDWNLFFICRIMFFTGLIFFLFSKPVILTILGDNWIEATPYFKGFALYILAIPLYSSIKHVFLARGNVTHVIITRFIMLFICAAGITWIKVMNQSWIILPWIISIAHIVGVTFLSFTIHKSGIRVKWLTVLLLPSFLTLLLLFLHYNILVTYNIAWFFSVAIYTLIWISIIFIFEHKKIRPFLSSNLFSKQAK